MSKLIDLCRGLGVIATCCCIVSMCAIGRAHADTTAADGAVGTNIQWEQGTFKDWYIELQREGVNNIEAGIASKSAAQIQEGMSAINWGFAKQGSDGSFPGTGDGTPGEPFHSTSLFIEAAARAVMDLEAYDPKTYGAWIAATIPHVQMGAEWLMTPAAYIPGQAYNQPYTHRRYLLAAALLESGIVAGNSSIEEASLPYISEGLLLQLQPGWTAAVPPADGDVYPPAVLLKPGTPAPSESVWTLNAFGVNPEANGYDVNYQCVGLVYAEYCVRVCANSTIRQELLPMIENGLAFETQLISPDGIVTAEGSSRIDQEVDLSGNLKVLSTGEIILAFQQAYELTGNPEYENYVRLLEDASNGTAELAPIAVSSSPVTGGTQVTVNIPLTCAAPTGGAVVALSTSSSAASFGRTSVTVPEGSTSITVPLDTYPVSANTPVTITAKYGCTHTCGITVLAPVAPAQVAPISVSKSPVIGGAQVTVTVPLTAPAPAGGAVVTLSTSSAAASFGKTSVTVPEGSTSVSVPLDTVPVTANTPVTITAKYGATHTCGMTVLAPAVTSVEVLPTKVVGGSTATGTLTLSGPTAAATKVTFSVNGGAASIPGTVTVPAGKSTVTFTVNTTAVAADTAVTIAANVDGDSSSAAITVKAPTLSSVSVSTASLRTGGSATLTATLSSKAPSGGIVVDVSYANGSALKNASDEVVIPAGATSGSIKLTGGSISETIPVGVYASFNRTNVSTALTVAP